MRKNTRKVRPLCITTRLPKSVHAKIGLDLTSLYISRHVRFVWWFVESIVESLSVQSIQSSLALINSIPLLSFIHTVMRTRVYNHGLRWRIAKWHLLLTQLAHSTRNDKKCTKYLTFVNFGLVLATRFCRKTVYSVKTVYYNFEGDFACQFPPQIEWLKLVLGLLWTYVKHSRLCILQFAVHRNSN